MRRVRGEGGPGVRATEPGNLLIPPVPLPATIFVYQHTGLRSVGALAETAVLSAVYGGTHWHIKRIDSGVR